MASKDSRSIGNQGVTAFPLRFYFSNVKHYLAKRVEVEYLRAVFHFQKTHDKARQGKFALHLLGQQAG